MQPPAAGLNLAFGRPGRVLRLLALFGWLLVLAACASGPAATMPELKLPSTAPSATKAPAAAALPRDEPALAPSMPRDAAAPAAAPADTAAENPSTPAGEILKEFQRGHASWYGPGFHGRRTASGERFDMKDYTAAHRTLPFGTVVRVHSLVNGRDVDVRITDRGPFSHNRIIDLSRAAAEELGMLGMGFKEVVLLIPESTPVAVDISIWPLQKKRSVVRRAPRARTR